MSSLLSNFTFRRLTKSFLVWLCIVTKNLICFWWDYHDWLCLLIFLLIAVTNLVAWWVSTCKMCVSFSSSLYLSFSQGKVNLRKIPLTISQGIKTDKFLWSREKSWWGITKLAWGIYVVYGGVVLLLVSPRIMYPWWYIMWTLNLEFQNGPATSSILLGKREG